MAAAVVVVVVVVVAIVVSMTSLLTHIVAHSARPMVVPVFIVFSYYYWSGLTVSTSMS